MHLVHNVELVVPARRRVLHIVDDNFANLIDLRVRGGVELKDVERIAGGDFLAHVADAAGIRRRGMDAVQRLGEDARGGSFARAARTSKQKCMMEAIGFQRILQSGANMVLSDQSRKILRSPASGDHFIGQVALRLLKVAGRSISHRVLVTVASFRTWRGSQEPLLYGTRP